MAKSGAMRVPLLPLLPALAIMAAAAPLRALPSGTATSAGYCAGIPVDLPLPSHSWPDRNDHDHAWLADGSPSLQGWDEYQKMLVDGATGPDADQWIQDLMSARLPGLGTVVMEPPRTGFRYGGGGGAGGSNETAFAAAVASLRRHGLRVVLYSSIVHKGEDAEWANGSLALHHPQWSQRHRDGSAATLESKPMLSPSNTEALNHTLNYTLDLLRRYPADGVYLDDNQLGGNATDPADYSAAALQKYREYLSQRFGVDWSARCLGIEDIPSSPIPSPPSRVPSPQERARWGVWLRFRQRTMALSNEAFCAALHSHQPPLALIAGNEVQFPSYVLATDLQLYHEDAVLTEDYDVEQWSAAKPMLMRGLAASPNAPALVGLFGMFNLSAKPEIRLRSAAALSVRMLGACMMTRTKPHLSYYGLQHTPPDAAQLAVAQTLQWFQRVRAALFDPPTLLATPSVAGTICRACIGFRTAVEEQSNWQLEIGGQWAVTAAQAVGAPVSIMSAANLGSASSGAALLPATLRVLLLENVTILSAHAFASVEAFAEAGGTVIATHDTATLDELGRALTRPQLRMPQASGPWGAGQLILVADPAALPDVALAELAAASWQVLTTTTSSSTSSSSVGDKDLVAPAHHSPRTISHSKSDWQLLPYVDTARPSVLLLHCLYLGTASGHQPAGAELHVNTTLELRVPHATAQALTVHSPAGDAMPGMNSFRNEVGGVRLTLRRPPVYLVVELNCSRPS